MALDLFTDNRREHPSKKEEVEIIQITLREISCCQSSTFPTAVVLDSSALRGPSTGLGPQSVLSDLIASGGLI